MVSLRRRRHLGLYSGKSYFPAELSGSTQNYDTDGKPNINDKSFGEHVMPSPSHLSHGNTINASEYSIGPSKAYSSTSSTGDSNQYYPGKQIKHRKQHRRKHHKNKEPHMMKGVYFKNEKWQAAIKVDKKQIHLGTVCSQEEAARLYDRAAYMCGREPNFELSEEAKQELNQYKWEEFLVITRNAITNKKYRKRVGGGRQKKT